MGVLALSPRASVFDAGVDLMKLGIFATHPVQYQAPWFRALAATHEVDVTVFYGLVPDAKQQGLGFGVDFRWDLPLLEGYRYEVLPNRARTPSLGRFGGCDTPEIQRILRERRFDAFLVTGWGSKASLQALLACRRSGTPCIVRGESNALKPRAWAVRLLHRLLLTQYKAFLAIGKSNEEFYLRNGVRREAIFPGRYCVDNDRLGAQARVLRPRRTEIRSAWNAAPEAFLFLFCGKLIDKKRPMDLIEALSRAHRADRNVQLLVVGDGELRGACETLARDRGLPAAFAGFLNQTEIAKGYSPADCLVLPSDYGETWGLVVNEAMACGLPAIVSDRVGCHADLILPGETGEVFPFADIEALTHAVARMASDPSRARVMGQRARGLVQGYSMSNLVAGTIAAAGYAAGSPSKGLRLAPPADGPRPC